MTTFKFSPQHLAALERCLQTDANDREFPGRIPATFARPVEGIDHAIFTDTRFTRSDVYRLAQDPDKDIKSVCVAILAWGGMKPPHRDLLFEHESSSWLDHAKRIRAGELDRKASYAGFAALRAESNLPGMGPAYFTKLIHFLMPPDKRDHPVGCILDQWLGCSANMLSEDRLVLMTKSGASLLVSDRNTAAQYDVFCKFIEALATRVSLTAIELDKLLLSYGGKNRGAWRKHVLQHRPL